MLRWIWLAGLAVCVGATSVWGQEGAAFSFSVTELKAASAAVPVTKEWGTRILYEEGHYSLAADGTLTYAHRMIYRVDTSEAAKGWAEISAQWDPWYEKPSQLHARVLQSDGSFVELDQKTVTDAPVKGEDTETFSSEHVRRAPLPGMAVGSIVEEQEITEEKIPYFAGGGLYRYGFGDNVPVARSRMIVEVPLALPFKDMIHNVPGLKVERSEADGKRKVVYEAVNLDALHDSDINLATNEPVRGIVEFSTGASWASIATVYLATSEPQTVAADTDAILPKDLPAGRMERIRAIVKVLHKEVRYTGVEFGAARLTPMRPAEVIKRHYGDCKDKATLLVAMLRASGIPAKLALLDTGVGRDVDPGLPGISQFDHAIVYVPATSSGGDALWIDATAETFAVGSIPYQDEGRNALVIDATTTSLLKTPAPKPEDSVLIETRTFKLAEYGPSTVEEVSETHGWVDASYREDFGGVVTPKEHENLENYVKGAYLAKKLVDVQHSDPTDFDKPFELRLKVEGARRGFSSLTDAVVAIFPTITVNNLPQWFGTAAPALGPDASDEAKHEHELAVKSRPATFALKPSIYEMRARVLIPAGFELRALPPARTTPLGPATLTESYSASEPGVVTATFRFNSGTATLTAEQALAMRDAVVELGKREYVGIFFDQAGAKAMTAGHIREALEIDRKLIAANPNDALAHLHLSRALLDAGIGSEAQVEARKATELDPKSSTAFSTLGWTLEHNALGERFGQGFDRAGAVAAYKQSVALDADDLDAQRMDLAILYEFDGRGTRYAEDADLPLSIEGYKELIERNKDKGEGALAQYRENLLYALLYSKRYAELDKTLATLPQTNAHLTLAISSAAAQHGGAAGIAQADKGNMAASDRNKDLRGAGTQLANLHLYSLAADMISAGMEGGDDAATAARQVELYRGLKVASLKPLPGTDAAAPVQAAMVGMMAGTLTKEQATALTSKHAYVSAAKLDRDATKAVSSDGFMRKVAEKSGMEESVMLDLILGNTTFAAKGDDATGYAVTVQIPGADPDHTYVVKEDGAYRIVAGDKDGPEDNAPLGNEILWELKQGNAPAAKAMLDWKRDLSHKGGGDDAFAGPLLPRFWTIGSTKPGADSPEAMRLAGIALLAGSMDAKAYLGEVAAAREKASGARQTDLDLLLAVCAMDAEDAAVGMPAVQRLLEQEPDSAVALALAGQGYSLENDAKGWLAMLKPRLEKKPGDRDLLVEEARAYELAHDWKAAQATEQKVLDSGKATANDYNNFAWMGLFHDDVDESIVKAAQQSAQMNKNSGFAELHTLACIYAAAGKTTEAREVLNQAMYASNQVQPNSAVWFALGMIYEQYGVKSAALAAYGRVEAHELDDHMYVDPTSTYVLARARIKALRE
jgi:tetratricopeptide (TPR) repeat protein